MKRVTTKEFFTVMWRGVRQAIGWFFGLFGYKRGGKFAKCVWGMFAVSSTIIVTIVAVLLLYGLGHEVYYRYKRNQPCDNTDCYSIMRLSRSIGFHNHSDGKGYVCNLISKEKILTDISWLVKPLGGDSLACFCDGNKRGYLNMNTGKVVINPKYDHAWVFSEGLAGVEEDGYIKFIDSTGKVVIDKEMVYVPGAEGYVFHDGYCVVNTDDGRFYGLMDKKGNIVLPQEYDQICVVADFKYKILQKGDKMAVLDKELTPVFPMTECSLNVSAGAIWVTMPDHTMRKYDLEGNLLDDFLVNDVRKLEYELDDIRYSLAEYDDYSQETNVTPWHPKATARLRAYTAGRGYEGLMTSDGRVVTKPLYSKIEAIGPDTYLCSVASCGDSKIMLNGKGEKIGE